MDLDAASLVLSFRVDGVEHRQTLTLSATRSHLGGIRFWFVCPVTNRRVRLLYLPDGHGQFASREAYGLSYRSQGETELFRQITKAQNIRARLRGDLSIHAPFPPRPRGMHRRTYERLRADALQIETAALAALQAREAALDATLSRFTPLSAAGSSIRSTKANHD